MAEFSPLILKTLVRNMMVTVKNTVADISRDKPKWIVVELSGSFPQREQKRKLTDFPPNFGPKAMTIERLEQDITQLCNAPWLEGVVFRFETLELDLATAYALRRQLERLKESNKKIAVFATQFGMSSYYLASVAHDIIMPESADLSVFGFAFQINFVKDALERFGVSFDKLAIKEFKNAGDNLARSSMSEAQREQMTALLEGFEDSLYEDIATSRKLERSVVKAWIDDGVTSAQEAQSKGMIDQVLYEDEFINEGHVLHDDAGRYLKAKRRSFETGRVAIISLEGTIVTGKSRRSPVPVPLFGDTSAGSDSIVAAFRAAEEDDSTKAIVFHVDSGGGSPLASDLMWREVVRIREKKPVIAVMGQYAASGGYYVLTHANKVIAAPTTLTGSIGVVTLKLITQNFNEKYGINVDVIQKGRYARVFSSPNPFTEDERQHVQKFIEETYDRFISKVAEGRNMSKEQVNDLGRGRVWTGQAALENGLVDELGDLSLGIQRAKEVAQLKPDALTYNVPVPKKFLLPQVDSAEAFMKSLNPLLSEKVLFVHPNMPRLL